MKVQELVHQFRQEDPVAGLPEPDLATSLDDIFEDGFLEECTAELENAILAQVDALATFGNSFDFEELEYQLPPKPEEHELLKAVQDNGVLESSLEKLWVIREGLKEIKVLYDLGEFESSLSSLDQVEHQVGSFEHAWGSSQPQITLALREHIHHERNDINKTILDAWKSAVLTQSTTDAASLSLDFDLQVGETAVDFGSLIGAVLRLDKDLAKLPHQKRVLAPPAQLDSLVTFIDENILQHILNTQTTSAISSKDGKRSVLTLTLGRLEPGSQGLTMLVDQLTTTINFLSSHFKEYSQIYNLITKRSSTRFISTLCNTTLKSILPSEESKRDEFEQHLQSLEDLESALKSAGWSRTDELQNWIRNFPSEWLEHRKEVWFDDIRQQLLGTKELSFKRVADSQFDNSVTSVEAKRQAVQESKAPAKKGHKRAISSWENDWDETFDDNKPEPTLETAEENAWNNDEDSWALDKDIENDGDKDGWGLDNDDIELSDQGDGDGEDWGWGDEDTNSKRKSLKPQAVATATPIQKAPSSHDKEKQSALLCTVTEYPDALVSTMQHFVKECSHYDAKSGLAPNFVSSHISDMLALYRALSPIGYKSVPSKWVLYNDTTQLLHRLNSDPELSRHVAEQDRERIEQQAETHLFTELRRQQARLDAILAQARGFQNCSQEGGNLFACQATVERTVNFFHELAGEWAEHASFPQRVKAVGRLLEHLCTTLIRDIEALDSIGEKESMELTKLISVVRQLEELFTDPTSESAGNSTDVEQAASSLTFYYTPSWIKLQYLAEILQSKLVDILYLYHHNSLVDFSGPELEGLVHALFAPSEHRRRALDEIRAGM